MSSTSNPIDHIARAVGLLAQAQTELIKAQLELEKNPKINKGYIPAVLHVIANCELNLFDKLQKLPRILAEDDHEASVQEDERGGDVVGVPEAQEGDAATPGAGVQDQEGGVVRLDDGPVRESPPKPRKRSYRARTTLPPAPEGADIKRAGECAWCVSQDDDHTLKPVFMTAIQGQGYMLCAMHRDTIRRYDSGHTELEKLVRRDTPPESSHFMQHVPIFVPPPALFKDQPTRKPPAVWPPRKKEDDED